MKICVRLRVEREIVRKGVKSEGEGKVNRVRQKFMDTERMK